jgi:hypothetical protein
MTSPVAAFVQIYLPLARSRGDITLFLELAGNVPLQMWIGVVTLAARARGLNPMRRNFLTLLLLCSFVLPLSQALGAPREEDSAEVIGEFLLLLLGSPEGKQQALEFVDTQWQPGFTPMLLEVLTFNRDAAFAPSLVALLEKKSGHSFGFNIEQWQQWLWNREPVFDPAYPEFKSALYGLLDERFENYFGSQRATSIRLDEVVWGGVKQDGIPPLRQPDMISAAQADYLADSDIVFGLEINGDVRAYPRRILGWHEMFVDDVGGVPVVGVYCTLCGTMILYQTRVAGQDHELGTSGFLYRSNKLMYDRATQSLWNTLWGKPVVGPLVGSDIVLPRLSVVTTTWGEWRRRHPETRVLSLATGAVRDYREGVAYRDYYATDALMFQVPGLDTRLRNKAEVLGLVFPQYPDQPLAIAADYLAQHTVYHDQVGELRFVVVTDTSGANRVYEARDLRFVTWDGAATLLDEDGNAWQLTEAQLRREDGQVLHRLPAHRAFWFGWYSAYSHTRLVYLEDAVISGR